MLPLFLFSLCSPCYPCSAYSPSFFHVLPPGMAGWNNLLSPGSPKIGCNLSFEKTFAAQMHSFNELKSPLLVWKLPLFDYQPCHAANIFWLRAFHFVDILISDNDLCSRECKAGASMVDSCYFDLIAFIKGIGKKASENFLSRQVCSCFRFTDLCDLHPPPIPFLGAISIWGFRPWPHKQTLSLPVKMQICYLTGLCFLSRGRFPFVQMRRICDEDLMWPHE